MRSYGICLDSWRRQPFSFRLSHNLLILISSSTYCRNVKIVSSEISTDLKRKVWVFYFLCSKFVPESPPIHSSTQRGVSKASTCTLEPTTLSFLQGLVFWAPSPPPPPCLFSLADSPFIMLHFNLFLYSFLLLCFSYSLQALIITISTIAVTLNGFFCCQFPKASSKVPRCWMFLEWKFYVTSCIFFFSCFSVPSV